MRPSHRRHDCAWAPSPRAWAYRRLRTWPAHYTTTDILKAIWPQVRIPRGGEQIMEIPPWAKLAFARHWMTADAYAKVPKEWGGRRMGHRQRITVSFEAP